MRSKFLLSLAAFSLLISLYAEESLTEEQEKEESVAKKSDEVISESPKRVKPHFAGVRRPAPKKDTDPAHVSSKIKNKWFSSKIHPKAGKKEAPQIETVAHVEPEKERPSYKRTDRISTQLAAMLEKESAAQTPCPAPFSCESSDEGMSYPKVGFIAPEATAYVTLEWLLWKTRQGGMEFAVSRSASSPGVYTGAVPSKIDFDYQSGFRVGLGVHLPQDGWDIYVNYTDFRPEHSHSKSGSLFPLLLFQGQFTTADVIEAHAHWDISVQSVDVEIGRAYHISKTLIMRPFIGCKGAWIDQNVKVRYEGGAIPVGQTYSISMHNDFKGAGVLIGIETNWWFGAGFSLFGNAAAALLAGHFDLKQEQHQLAGVETVDLKSDLNLVSPMADLVLGLAWDRNFSNDRFHVGLSGGFETQYWWSQQQTERFTADTQPIFIRGGDDLAFYGLTLRGRFDF
jgi:hypothetical protein